MVYRQGPPPPRTADTLIGKAHPITPEWAPRGSTSQSIPLGRRATRATGAAPTGAATPAAAGTEVFELLLLLGGQDLAELLIDFLLQGRQLRLLGVGQFQLLHDE